MLIVRLFNFLFGATESSFPMQQPPSTDPNEGVWQAPEGIWQVGMLLEMKPSFPPLRDRALSVIVSPPGAEVREGGVALCKAGLFDTYDHVNEYTGNEGCGLKAADHTQCRYPSVLVAAVACGAQQTREDLLEHRTTDSHEVLTLPVGAARRVSPALLLVTAHFLAAYGFSPKEQVWFRAFAPLPLERVILALLPEVPLSSEQIEAVVGQLYQRSEQESVVLQQDFDFRTQVMLPDPTRRKGRGQWAGAEAVPQPVAFQVLETVPVLQGRITKETVVAVAPPSVKLGHTSPNMGSDDEQSMEEAMRPRASSAESASDFPHAESSLMKFVQQASCLEPQDYSVEAVAAEGFKLQSQGIVLPEQEAKDHGIYNCQNVWVRATKESSQGQGAPLEEVVLPLEGEVARQRMHVALAYLYDDAATLEHYVPTPVLGGRHEGASLSRAYIHPELLFFLYPETVAASRRFWLTIKGIFPTASQGTLPTVKQLVVSQVTMPGQKMANATVLQEFLEDKTLYVSVGDVFGIHTDTDKLYYKVEFLEPKTEENAGMLDRTFKEGRIEKSRSYRPDVVPPSPLLPSPSYWSHTHPPGLEDYCNNLFANFIPLLRESSCRPHRSPSVLVTGPPGVGKRTVVRAVARRCRLHFLEFNCFEFSSDATAFSEKKLVTELTTAISCAPSVVVLRQIHILGRKDNAHEEPRLSSTFELFMDDISNFNRTSKYPVIVVGMTPRPRDIPPRVHGCFLHQLEVAPPTLSQREDMLAALVSEIPSSAPDINCKELAKRTAGFVLGDFTTLLTKATQMAFADVSSRGGLQGHSHADLAISGVVVTRDHLETALDTLHSSHSDAIGAPKIPTVEWDDVGGLAEAKREILDTIQLPLFHPELFTSGLRRSGVLLYGAPGTGKTLLAKAVATECSLNFLSVKGPELINLYVGQSEENVREVFARARSAAPCVIFFDELDSIAPNRGRSGDSGGVMDRVVSQLLAELDGLQKSEDVFVIGATNRPDLIDPALLRPGRFDRLVYLGISEDVDSKVKILKAITRKFHFSDDVDLMSLAQQCPVNLTGADLYALCSDAMLTALRRQVDELEQRGISDDHWTGKLVVGAVDFQEALQHLTPSVSSEQLQQYDSLRGTLAS